MLLHSLRQLGYQGKIALFTANTHDQQRFVQEGADLVLSPYSDASREAVDRLLRNISKRGPEHSEGETA